MIGKSHTARPFVIVALLALFGIGGILAVAAAPLSAAVTRGSIAGLAAFTMLAMNMVRAN